jgi:hypothetical protein
MEKRVPNPVLHLVEAAVELSIISAANRAGTRR